LRFLAVVWGVGGVVLLLVSALVRLTPMAWQAVASGLDRLQWTLLVVFTIWMAWSEGYRGFQKNFSPRVAARARHLAEHPTALRVALAPLFCMAYFGAPRRRTIVTLVLTLAIVGLVVAVRRLSQPWRGIIDAGVVVGLAWGLLTLLWYTVRAFSPRGISHPPEVVG
jgi:hypothetical protein